MNAKYQLKVNFLLKTACIRYSTKDDAESSKQCILSKLTPESIVICDAIEKCSHLSEEIKLKESTMKPSFCIYDPTEKNTKHQFLVGFLRKKTRIGSYSTKDDAESRKQEILSKVAPEHCDTIAHLSHFFLRKCVCFKGSE